MIYLIRHGQSQNNRKHIIGGNLDNPLSEQGKKQAEHLARLFGKKQLDAVLSSSLSRAKDTANILARAQGLTPVVSSLIDEIDFGDWQGMTFAQVREKYPEEYQVWRYDWTNFYAPGGECFADVESRCQSFLQLLIEEYDGCHVAVVAHQGILRVLMATLFHNYDMRIKIRNTGVIPVDLRRDGARMIICNFFDD